MEKSIFIFDQNKCVGCHACVVACFNENGLQLTNSWRNIYISNESHFPTLPLFYLSLACNHCNDAPCLINCPALAYSRDENTGAIIHDPEKCIGCKYCTWACPYDAPKFNIKKGVIEKCTFCNHRLNETLKPACANLCPAGALDFSIEEFSREESQQYNPLPVDVGSSIKIIPLRNTNTLKIDHNLFKNQPNRITTKSTSKKINAVKEWPLLLFTLISAALVGIYLSGRTAEFSALNKITYLTSAFLAVFLSLSHLGKKLKVWRSILNPSKSWLSKEIINFGLFFTFIFLEFFIFDIPNVIIVFLGITLLISIDMLYNLASWKWPLKIHSAHTILIALTLYALLANNMVIFSLVLSFRATIYIYRKLINKNSKIISAIRIISLFACIISYVYQINFLLFISFFVIGEIIDRIEFYNELNVPDPSVEFASI